jgi:hypothetical protein
MKIIGLFAQLANGKDEVANHLAQILNDFGTDQQKWKRLGFADAVKHVFMQSFNVTWEWIEEWKRKSEIPPGFDLTVRQGLQHIGDGFRKIQSDVWIRTALRNGDHSIISDGRYINEAKMIKDQGGFNVLLWRPGFENNDPNPSESQIRPYVDFAAIHYKEGPLSDLPLIGPHPVGFEYFDYFLINNGTLEDLYGKIDNKLMQYLQEIETK